MKAIPSMIRNIVDRCHVGDSDIAMLRYFRSRLSDEGRSRKFRAMRKEYYRMALIVHHENQRLYGRVMGGR